MQTRNKLLKTSHCAADEESCESSSKPAVHTLNDDCLMNIFMFLQIKDRIKIERVCKRWKAVSAKSWQNVKTLDISKEIWGFELRCKLISDRVIIFKNVLQRCGLFLRRIDLSLIILNNNIIHDVGKLCPNLQSINVQTLKLTKYPVKTLTNNCHNLTEITFGDCTKGCDDLHLSKLFLRNQKLRYLKIVNNSFLTGEFLLNLPKESMETIIIRNCSKVLSLHVSNALEKLGRLQTFSWNSKGNIGPRFHSTDTITSMPKTLKILEVPANPDINISSIIELCNLEKLDISQLEYVTDAFLIALAANCKNLSYLNINECRKVTDVGVQAITQLPKLEVLCLENLSRITDEALKHIPNLKKLYCYRCENLKDNGLCTLVETCDTLEILNLCSCSQITNFLVDCAIKATKSRTNNLVLNLSLIGTSVNPDDINESSPFLEMTLPHANELDRYNFGMGGIWWNPLFFLLDEFMANDYDEADDYFDMNDPYDSDEYSENGYEEDESDFEEYEEDVDVENETDEENAGFEAGEDEEEDEHDTN